MNLLLGRFNCLVLKRETPDIYWLDQVCASIGILLINRRGMKWMCEIGFLFIQRAEFQLVVPFWKARHFFTGVLVS